MTANYTVPKRVITIHSLAGFGRSSTAIILPVLSAMGIQCCPVPTAVLSTHTGGLGAPSVTSLSHQLPGTLAHYKQLPAEFAGLYTGYLGGEEQVESCIEYCNSFPHAFKLVDPVMGDNGKAYSGISDKLIKKIDALCSHADVITPNSTEAALLLNEDLSDLTFTDQKAQNWGSRLCEICAKVVITGAQFEDGKYNLIFENGVMSKQSIDYVQAGYPGTGDLFAATMLGSILNGNSLQDAVAFAAGFVHDCIMYTVGCGTDSRFGVSFEPLMCKLTEAVK